MTDRRKFIQNSSALVAGSFFFFFFKNKAFAIFKNKIAPSDQINVGAIGINGMGFADLSSALKIPGVNVVALCDVDQNVLDKRIADLAKKNVDTSRIKKYNDYRKLLAQKDIDVVFI